MVKVCVPLIRDPEDFKAIKPLQTTNVPIDVSSLVNYVSSTTNNSKFELVKKKKKGFKKRIHAIKIDFSFFICIKPFLFYLPSHPVLR